MAGSTERQPASKATPHLAARNRLLSPPSLKPEAKVHNQIERRQIGKNECALAPLALGLRPDDPDKNGEEDAVRCDNERLKPPGPLFVRSHFFSSL